MAKSPSARLDDDAVSIALNKLASIPNVGRKDRIPVPFPYEPDPPFSVGERAFWGAKHQRVPLDSLVALQPTVSRKKVEYHIKRKGTFSNPPTIVRVEGVNYIADGHHRSTAEKLLGKPTMRANFIDLSDGE